MSLQLISKYESDSDDQDYDNMEIDEPCFQQSTEEKDISFAVNDIIQVLLTIIENRENFANKSSNNFKSNYRFNKLIESDSDSDSNELSPWNITDSENYDESESDTDQFKKSKPCITKGELTLNELPPIEKLKITVLVHDLAQLGTVCSIVDQLVVIQSFKNIPPLDLDTVLFSKDGFSLGKIFDVIGQVKQPNYILRFNSVQEILDLNIVNNFPVYYAENYNHPITNYVFIDNLRQNKGSDASWKHNNEPPPNVVDYSDDETERIEKWKKSAKSRRKNM